jgi:hypothetical protein
VPASRSSLPGGPSVGFNGRVILALGALTGLALLLVLVLRPGKAARLRLGNALLLVPVAFGALFGLLWLGAFLTQRALPEPLFAAPLGSLAWAAGAGAVAFFLFARARARLLQVVLVEACVAIGALAVNYHASFGETVIRIRPLLACSERSYRYDQVRSVKFVTHAVTRSGPVPRPRFVVEFQDGTRWCTHDGFRDFVNPYYDMTAIELVAQRSNCLVQNVLTIPER